MKNEMEKNNFNCINYFCNNLASNIYSRRYSYNLAFNKNFWDTSMVVSWINLNISFMEARAF